MTTLKNIILNLIKDKKVVKQSLIVWLVIYLLFILLEFIADGTSSIIGYIELTFIEVWICILFYIHFLICYLFLEKNKAKFYIGVAVTFISHVALVGYYTYRDQRLYANQSYSTVAFFLQLFFYGIICYLIIIFISTIYWSQKNNLTKTIQNAVLKQDKILLQAQLLQSENNFLRAQINPHFLYNCLNFLYSKTFKQQPDVAEAIMILSQIMRYSLSDFSGTNGLANLEDEMEHIKNLIKINDFRFDNRLQIKFYLEGDAPGKMIAPMLLMTLVENVFKHGDLQDIAYAATVTCKINDTNKTIQFVTINKKNKSQNVSDPGVGLANIKQRLQLLYKDNYTLIVIDEPVLYTVKLIMPYFD